MIFIKALILIISLITVPIPMIVYYRKRQLFMLDEYKDIKKRFIALVLTVVFLILFISLSFALLKIKLEINMGGIR